MAEDYMLQVRRDREARKKKLDGQRAGIFAAMKKHGVSVAHVNYDGSGDDGQVNDTEFFNKEGIDLTGRAKSVLSSGEVKLGEYGAGVIGETSKTATLYELVEDFGSGLLDDAPFDWVNNEGGFGYVLIDADKKTITFEHNYRTESSVYEQHEA